MPALLGVYQEGGIASGRAAGPAPLKTSHSTEHAAAPVYLCRADAWHQGRACCKVQRYMTTCLQRYLSTVRK